MTTALLTVTIDTCVGHRVGVWVVVSDTPIPGRGRRVAPPPRQGWNGSAMILVSGATGELGGRITRRLVD